MCCLSTFIWLTPSVFIKWKVLMWYTYWASLHWYEICCSSVFSFKCFRTSRNCHFRLLLVGILIRIPQKQLTFFTIDEKQDDASDMPQFFEILRNGRNCFFFVYTLIHPMRYTPRFCQLKNLVKMRLYVVSFISVAYVVVQLKVFKSFFCINSASMKWPLFGTFWALTLPNIVWSC